MAAAATLALVGGTEQSADPPSQDASMAGRPAILHRTEGRLAARWRRDGERTRLADLYQQIPCRLLQPRRDPAAPPLAVLASVSGGVLGGDRLETAITLDAGAEVEVIGQAAEKIYRSAGATACVINRLTIGPQASLNWMPQGTILFQGARLVRDTAIDLAASARLLWGEILIYGRRGHGERLTKAHLHDRLDIRIDGRRVLADRFRLSSDHDSGLSALGLRHALDDAEASALAVLHVPGLDAADTLDGVRDWLERGRADGVRAGVTRRGPLLICRWLGRRADDVRRSLIAFWQPVRSAMLEMPGPPPAIWSR